MLALIALAAPALPAVSSVLVGCDDESDADTPSDEGATPQPSLRYRLTLERAVAQWVEGEVEFSNFDSGTHVFVVGKDEDSVVFDDVQLRTAGRSIPLGSEDGRYTVRLEGGAGTLSWKAKPIEDGKHGRVGYFGAEFAALYGGMLLLPEAELRRELEGRSGRASIEDVRIEVDAPEGWDVVSTFRRRGQSFDPAVNGKWRFRHLQHGSFGLGQFQHMEKKVGEVTHRIHMPATWPPNKREAISERLWRIHQAYESQLPCDSLTTYTTIFVPPRPDGGRVAGDFWSTGQLFAFDAYPEDPRRPFELFAHRIAHAANKYEICGMHIDDAKERWFTEGWASWSETTHLIAAQVASSEERLAVLGNRYRTALFGLDVRITDVPVWFESRPGREPNIEYLHYTKAPLIVSMLDYELRRRSNGRKHVNDFLHEVYPRYRGGRRPLRLFDELESYLGESLSEFRERYVEQRASIYPVYAGSLAYLRRQAGQAQTAAIEVEGAAMSQTQRDALRSFFRTSELVPATQTEETATDMLRIHAQYLADNRDEIPAEILEFAHVLPASVRYQLYLDEKRALQAN